MTSFTSCTRSASGNKKIVHIIINTKKSQRVKILHMALFQLFLRLIFSYIFVQWNAFSTLQSYVARILLINLFHVPGQFPDVPWLQVPLKSLWTYSKCSLFFFFFKLAHLDSWNTETEIRPTMCSYPSSYLNGYVLRMASSQGHL